MTNFKVLNIEHMTQSDILNVIMPGDVVRFTGPGEHDITTRQVAEDNGVVVELGECTYTLRGLSEGKGSSIEITGVLRPIPDLPTVPGYYESAEFPLSSGHYAYRLDSMGRWIDGSTYVDQDYMRALMPLTRLVPETETAPAKLADRIDVQKLADVMSRVYHGSSDYWDKDAAAIIAAIDSGELDK